MPTTEEAALQIRRLIITMIAEAGSGHPGGALGLADIFSVLYFSKLLSLNPPSGSCRTPYSPDPNRDRIIVSNGHVCPVWYATLALRGYFPVEELNTLRIFGSRLQGHPHHNFSIDSPLLKGRPAESRESCNLPGIENTAGPLGQGISFAAGLALGLRQQSNNARVICITGDGELNEGQAWEAFMFASKYKLSNLTYIIDRNDIQIDGFTHDVMPTEPLKEKLAAFGLRVFEIDGNNHKSIYQAIKRSSDQTTFPTAIIAHTTPGKGVPFMENKFEWHGKAPSHEEATQALGELC